LAQALAGRAARDWPTGRDELQSTAFLALVEAAQAFDPSRNIDFATYARHRIRGALIDVQREMFSEGWRGRAEQAPRFQPLEADSEERGRVVGVQAEGPVGTELETADAIENWLQKLPARHSTAFRHLYLDGKTLEEAAVLVGCSKASMSRLHRETLTWFHQADFRSTTTTTMKTERKPYVKKDPITAVPTNGRDRILASWSLRSKSQTQPQPCFGVAG
jgi:RNA polymerase sigma factor for flagellar operon FliA